MSKNKHKSYSFSDSIQYYIEQNVGKVPVWQFPPIPKMQEGFSFFPLTFRNRFHLLDLFKKDKDIWVDKRFKKAKSIYEYVSMTRIVMPYAYKRGGEDWLVYKKKECIGILHGFEFSKETGGLSNRRCSIGYIFGKEMRGSGMPQKVIRHFQDFLFTKMNLLYLSATVDCKNLRSIRFLEGLGYLPMPAIIQWESEEEKEEGESKTVIMELFRSKRAQNKINKLRMEVAAANRAS